MQQQASTPAASTIAFAAQFVQIIATFATPLHFEPRAKSGTKRTIAEGSGLVLWFARVVPIALTDKSCTALYTRSMRASWIVMLALTIGCTSPYTPTPLPPLPSPTPTPTPNPSPPPVSVQPFNLSLYASPTPIAGKQTNLILAITGTAPTEPLSVNWTFGDGATAMTTKNQTPHTYARSGKVTAIASVVDAAGRRGSTQTIFTVDDPPEPEPTPPPPPPPSPTYLVAASASPTSVVIGDPTTITATAIAQNGAPAATSYQWDCTNDGTIDQTTATPSVQCSYTSAGVKTVGVTARSASAAGSGTTTVTVTNGAPLFVGVVASKQDPAIGESVIFTATVTSSGPIPSSFEWYWDDTSDGVVNAFETGSSPRSYTTSYGLVGAKTLKVKIIDTITGREATGTQAVTVQ